MEAAKIHTKSTFEQIVEAIKHLSPKEKSKLKDIIWADNTFIPQEHQDLVLDRLEKGRKNPERLLDWDEFSKTF
jgi:hypothetical protein